MVATALRIASSIALAFAWLSPVDGAESAAKNPTGLERIQLVTPVDAVTPGETLTVGLVIDPEPDFHTYWKGPGSVGVATTMEWDLPEGFEAGEIIWPPPQKTLMAGVRAHGYRTETCLLTDIRVPPTLEGDLVTLQVEVAWMACAVSCHPGVTDFALELPVNRSGQPADRDPELAERFREIRESVPRPAPSEWKLEPRLASEDRIELRLTVPGGIPEKPERTYFYCYDLQVDSDRPQRVEVIEGDSNRLRLLLPRPDFAPPDPDRIAGVLHHPEGWPGVDSPWVEVSAAWPEGTFDEKGKQE